MGREQIQVREGRIFIQLEELVPYELMQCGGLTDWGRPRGAITPIREQSLTKIGEEDVVGYQRASADMAAFTLTSRLKEIGNFLVSLNCEANVQVIHKDCGDPENYYGFKFGIGWVRCPPGDLAGEPLAVIEGDNVPVGLTNPFNAIYGPYMIDFDVKFLSRRDIAETGVIMDIVMFAEECLEACLFKAGNGQYGYLTSSAQAGSPIDDANVWFTEDYGDEWALTSANPFGGGEDISSIVKVGTVTEHRVIVSRGSTDAANPAEIAYADVDVIGQTEWVTVDVGEVNGQYIIALTWSSFSKLYAVTNDGYVYKSTDGGVTWEISYQDDDGTQFNDITFTKRGVGWACGDDDLLILTTNNGSTWTVIDGPNDGALNLTACYVDGERKLIVGDSAGNLYATVDEGVNWVETPIQGIVATNIVRIHGAGTHWKWVIADLAVTIDGAQGNSRVLRSTDGGASWRLWDLAQNIVPNNGLFALYVVDLNRALVAGAPQPVNTVAFLTRTETEIDRIVS